MRLTWMGEQQTRATCPLCNQSVPAGGRDGAQLLADYHNQNLHNGLPVATVEETA